MRISTGAVAAGAIAVLITGAVVLGKLGPCSGPTKVERRADSTLQTVPAWQDTVRARDSALTVRDRLAARLRRQSIAERLRADSAEHRADSLQQWADDLAEVPTNLPVGEQNTQLRVALAAQKQAAAQFRVTVGALKVQRSTDSLRIQEADSTLTQMRAWRDEDLARIDRLTTDLSDLRAEGKRKAKFLGFLPPWVDEALLVAGSVTVGIAIGRS